MEEHVGQFWHRLVTHLAHSGYPAARVKLQEVERCVGILFRALGGDGGLQITSAEADAHGARRGWLQRLAGGHEKLSLAWRDAQFLRLPPSIDWLPERRLNRELYLWLAASASLAEVPDSDWFVDNQRRVVQTLAHFPGMEGRYRRLMVAHLATRPLPGDLPADEARAEQAVRQALLHPGSSRTLPAARHRPRPVPLWLHPHPPQAAQRAVNSDDPADGMSGDSRRTEEALRRRAERVEAPEGDRGLVTVRMENIFTWGEFVKVDRGSEDEDDPGRAEAVARDLDQLAVSRDAKRAKLSLKFDLDLPAAGQDDHVLGAGILLPEWDWKRRRLQPEHCRIVPMLSADAIACALPVHLRPTARRLRAQFQALAPSRVWHRAQPDGQDIDLDGYLRFACDRAAGRGVGAEGLYRAQHDGARDLVCALLADLSLSTDSWIGDRHRVIDVIRDSLLLFAESLATTGDRFGLYGFSSRKRDPVRVHTLKDFDEPYGSDVRGRIVAIRPGYYTRMGAALRYGCRLLSAQPGGRRLLLLLTDGKPNDLDQYEGRYGIEDTRQAVIEARRAGLQPFCVTIDDRGNDYLPYLFGNGGYVVIRRPSDLPRELPRLYARLTI